MLGVALLVATPGLAGCGFGGIVGRKCTPEADAVMRRLEASPVLQLIPPDTTAHEPYSKRPCDDDDNLGSVSRQLTSTLKDRELLTYFREEFPKQGWGLRQELPGLSREPDGLRTGEPHQCYENPAEPNVTLEIFLGLGDNPDTDLFVAFHFNGGTYSCANTTSPAQTR
ncbi:hypothetical protein [Lentzea terrae]|uniref:hypothetical protein n=1 Tax=Lentzea terrae TaxID=2200761 RepID=UPI000DD43746|nr:hypothetical protein [Lentzea terrae]